MYHLNKKENKNDLDMSQFSKYDIGKSIENQNELQNQKILINYMKLYQADYQFDAKICSLLMNYFSLTLNENLNYFFTNGSIPLQSFILHAEMNLSKRETDIYPKFNDNNLTQNALSKIYQHVLEKCKDMLHDKSALAEDKQNLSIILIITVQSLLRKFISKFSKEVDSILELIRCYMLIYAAYINLINEKDNKRAKKSESADLEEKAEEVNLDNDPIRELIELKEKWFDKECSESLLINFGVKQRSQKEIDEHDKELRIQKESKKTGNKATSVLDRANSFHSNDVEDDAKSIIISDEMNSSDSRKLERIASRRIEYWGITNEFEIYSKLLAERYFNETKNETGRSNFQSDYTKQMMRLFEKRIDRRLKIDFDEVIKFRIRFNFEKFGSRSNKNDFENIVDKLVCRRLNEATTNYDLKQLCDSLKENTQLNQARLHYYVRDLLVNKWPAIKEKDNQKVNDLQFRIIELEFAIKWSSFIELKTCQLDHESKNCSLPLDSKWIQSFNNVLGHFMQCVEEIVNGSATIQIVKLFHVNLKDTYKLVEFLVSRNLSGKLPINKSNLIIFKALIEIRMRECLEFERYRSNLKAFVQFCNNFKQVNVKAYEKQLASLGKMENLDKETKLNSICAIKNFEHDITDELIKIIDEKRQLEKIEEIKPKITYFLNINLTNMPTIDEIINLNRSCCVIFDSYFSNSCDKVRDLHTAKNKDINELNIEHVINEVWPLARNKWQQVTTVIQNGKIKLVELDEMLKAYFKENYSKMQTELIYMNGYFKIQNLNLRNEQIK
jgi:hypothetical protein